MSVPNLYLNLEAIKWNLQDSQRQSPWGAPAPESWFKQGIALMGAETKAPEINEDRIIVS